MRLIVYGALWCPDVRFARQALDEQNIPYEFINIETLDVSSVAPLVEANGGEDWAVPTFFAQGRYYPCLSMDSSVFQKVLDYYQIA